MHRIFLSYAREDLEAAKRLFRSLNSSPGVDVWFDQERLLPGHQWEVEIEKAIGECDFFLLLLSRNSTEKKGYYQKEVRKGLDVWESFPEGRIFLVPVRLDDCTPHFRRLGAIHYVDLFPNWDDGVDRIVRALQVHSSGPGLLLKPDQGIRFRAHQARFGPDTVFCIFLHIANLRDQPIEVTHVYYEDFETHIPVSPASRPLPKRLEPAESIATWIALGELPERAQANPFGSFRLHLSTGETFLSQKNESIPIYGALPGGDPNEEDLARLALEKEAGDPGKDTVREINGASREGHQEPERGPVVNSGLDSLSDLRLSHRRRTQRCESLGPIV